MIRYFFVLLVVLYVKADHFAYIGFFPTSDCSGDPYAVSPIFDGEAQICAAPGETTCLASLTGITTAPDCGDIRINEELEDGTGIRQTLIDNSTVDAPYNFCLPSVLGTIPGCSFMFRPVSSPFSISGEDDVPSDSRFVTFANYFADSCSNNLEVRFPIFEGENRICVDDSGTDCVERLRGISLPPANINRDCITREWSIDNCDVSDSVESYELSVCSSSSQFTDCDVIYSEGLGLNEPCATPSEHFAYIGFFPTADCSGDPYAVSPIYTGEAQICPAQGETTCLGSLSGITQAPDCGDIRINQELEDGTGIRQTFLDNSFADAPYNFCLPSVLGTVTGCSFMFVPKSTPFSITGGNEIPDDSRFVTFLNYFTDSCSNDLELRIPILEGSNTICVDSTANNCVDSLRGISLPHSHPDVSCDTQVWDLDECNIIEGSQDHDFGICENSDDFPRCDLKFSQGLGLNEPCGEPTESEEHFAYIGFFPTSDCSGDPYAVSPIFTGEAQICPEVGETTCLGSLSGITKADCDDVRINEELPDGTGIRQTLSDGTPQDAPYNFCIPSILGNIAECSFMFVPKSTPFTISGEDEIPDDPRFVTFLNYFTDSCSNDLEARIPILEGSNTICVESSGQNCVDRLRGFGLPHDNPDLVCSSENWSLDECDISRGSDIQTFGICESSGDFLGCDITYSQGLGIDQQCGVVEEPSSHFAYVGFFDTIDCSGDPYTVSPIYPGEAQICPDETATSCISALRGILKPDNDCNDIRINTELPGVGVRQTLSDGTITDIPYGFCVPSVLDNTGFGCSILFKPADTPFEITGEIGTPGDSGFVAFANYFKGSCSNSLELRVPIFSGDNEFCYDSSATNCIDSLRGFSLPPSSNSRECEIHEYDIDVCDIIEDVNIHSFGVCENSDNYKNCDFSYSQGFGLGEGCDTIIDVDSHFAYVGFFDTADCSGDPLVVSPIYPGESQICPAIGESTCLGSLTGLTKGIDCGDVRINEELPGGLGVKQTAADGTFAEAPYNFCVPSILGNVPGCTFKFIPASSHFVLEGGGDPPSDSRFVTFLNYFTNTCENELELRIPIFDGENTICTDSSANTCSGALRGFSLPPSNENLRCETTTWSVDECNINEESNPEFGICENSETFNDCDVILSQGIGIGEGCTGTPKESSNFAYIGFFSSADCSGDPQAVSPIFPGEAQICPGIDETTCIGSLRGITQAEDCGDIRINEELADGTGIRQTLLDGTISDVPYGFCVPSVLGNIAGCSFMFVPKSLPFELSGGDIPSDSRFISYLNYYSNSCENELQMRIPIFEGENTICFDSSGETCTDSLRGLSLPNDDPNRSCITRNWSVDNCDILEGSTLLEYGVCHNSNHFSDCDVILSQGLGPNEPCNGTSTSPTPQPTIPIYSYSSISVSPFTLTFESYDFPSFSSWTTITLSSFSSPSSSSSSSTTADRGHPFNIDDDESSQSNSSNLQYNIFIFFITLFFNLFVFSII